MAVRTSVWLWSGAVLLALTVAAAFLAYLQPGLLLDFLNLRYCG